MSDLQISVCVPVFQTERFLAQCLRSVMTQDFSSFEILVVSDASDGKDQNGKSAAKITRLAQKLGNRFRRQHKLKPVKIHYLEHSQNRGVFEVRRTLCINACGQYICFLDSDDELEEGALSALYQAAIKNNSDVVQGVSTSGYFDKTGCFIPSNKNVFSKIYKGIIHKENIFNAWLLDNSFSGMCWAKLYLRELLLKSYDNIPYTQCNMADDLLLSFFVYQYANCYCGINAKVYKYRLGQGMTSRQKIKDLKRWELICSSASVFSIIYLLIEEKNKALPFFTPKQVEALRLLSGHYIENALIQLKQSVIPDLQQQAYDMLCDYWGKSLVERMKEEQLS